MPSSRAVVVLGMHRNGTSLLTRGLQALGVDLGSDFLETKPDNPTGYWEDRQTVALNEKLLGLFGRQWESTELITEEQWREADLEPLRRKATDYLRSHFLNQPLWGFKDPRTILLLPFWRPLFESLDVDDRYIVAVRNPLSVAASLKARQSTPGADAHLLWLLYMVPQLHRIAGRPFVVVDYDLLMNDPGGQMIRIAQHLDLPLDPARRSAVVDFAKNFVDPHLRHSVFSIDDFETQPDLMSPTREAYPRLHRLAIDQIPADFGPFWTAWKRLGTTTATLLADAAERKREAARQLAERVAAAIRFAFTPRPAFPGAKFFLVTGTQRTGTSLLRRILNNNRDIAMAYEILTPCPPPRQKILDLLRVQPVEDTADSYLDPGAGPADLQPGLNYHEYWGNFLRTLPPGAFPAATPVEAEALLDRYFDYLLEMVRTRWAIEDKKNARAIGLDIKYTHLHRLAPLDWPPGAPSFLLGYLRSRGVPLVHMLRRNIVQCAISGLVMTETGRVHNYENTTIKNHLAINAKECLGRARWIVRERDKFLAQVHGFTMVNYEYEDLTRDSRRTDPITCKISDEPGPLHDIAAMLDVPFQFSYGGALKKSINIPYSELLANFDEIVEVVKQSEFAEFASTLS